MTEENRPDSGDVDKKVTGDDGIILGSVDRVENGTAYVEAAIDIAEEGREHLHWNDERDEFAITAEEIEEITDDEVIITTDR
jgi:hypothetical protein